MSGAWGFRDGHAVLTALVVHNCIPSAYNGARKILRPGDSINLRAVKGVSEMRPCVKRPFRRC